MVLSIFSGIEDFFYKILWMLCQGILEIIANIQKAFMFLTGVEPLPINGVETTLMDALFGIYWDGNGIHIDFSSPVHKAYISILFLFVIVLILALVIGSIKISVNKQDKESLPSYGKMFYKALIAFGIVIIMPIMFILALGMVGLAMEFIISVLSIDLLNAANDTNLAQSIFQSTINASTWNSLLEQPGGIVDLIKYSMSYDDLARYIGNSNINWVMLVLSASCVLVGVVMASITVAERLINIVLLYLISPLILGSVPLDDGKRFENWKDNVSAKILSAAGNIISLYIFLFIITVFGTKILANPSFVLQLTFLILCISGAFVSAKGGTIISSLISANAGQQEGMSFMASQQLLKMGTRVAAGVAGGAAALAGIKSGASNAGNRSGFNQANGSRDMNHQNGNNFNGEHNDSTGVMAADNFNNSKGMNQGINSPNSVNNSAENSNAFSDNAKKPSIASRIMSGGNKAIQGTSNIISKTGEALASGAGSLRNNMNVPGLIRGATKTGVAALAGASAILSGRAIKSGIDGTKNAVNHLKGVVADMKHPGLNKLTKASLGKATQNPNVAASYQEAKQSSKELIAAKEVSNTADVNFNKSLKTLNGLSAKKEEMNLKGKNTDKIDKKIALARDNHSKDIETRMAADNQLNLASNKNDLATINLSRDIMDAKKGKDKKESPAKERLKEKLNGDKNNG